MDRETPRKQTKIKPLHTVCLSVCVCVCVYVCMYVHVCVCVYHLDFVFLTKEIQNVFSIIPDEPLSVTSRGFPYDQTLGRSSCLLPPFRTITAPSLRMFHEALCVQRLCYEGRVRVTQRLHTPKHIQLEGSALGERTLVVCHMGVRTVRTSTQR